MGSDAAQGADVAQREAGDAETSSGNEQEEEEEEEEGEDIDLNDEYDREGLQSRYEAAMAEQGESAAADASFAKYLYSQR